MLKYLIFFLFFSCKLKSKQSELNQISETADRGYELLPNQLGHIQCNGAGGLTLLLNYEAIARVAQEYSCPRDVVKDCVIAHEQRHIDDEFRWQTNSCVGKNIGEERGTDPCLIAASECNAYSVQLSCLNTKAPQCTAYIRSQQSQVAERCAGMPLVPVTADVGSNPCVYRPDN